MSASLLATKRRALELGAAFIAADLAELRRSIAAGERAQLDYDLDNSRFRERPEVFPATTSHEGDFLKAVEWASAAAILRCLAEEA